jgi:hypothetical protein
VTGATIHGGVKACIGPILYVLVAAGLGHWLGGGAALSRADAALLVPTLVLAALLVEFLPRQWRPGSIFAAIALPTALLLALCWAATMWLADTTSVQGQSQQSAFLVAASIVILTLVRAARFVLSKRHVAVRALVFAMLATIWWLGSNVVLGRAYAVQAPSEPRKTLILTSLPLRTWVNGGAAIEGPRDSAAVAALRHRIAPSLMFADGLAAGSVGPDDRLLLAHPAALPPETLVEVDRFVRAGGRAVILADGLSSWPPPHPLGDPRNPPVTSLLTPLLDHWGVRLDAPVPGGASSEAVTVMHQGHRLALHSPGHFARLPGNCRGAAPLPDSQPTIATCRIGQGTVVLLADADMLFDPLWRPQPLWAAHLRPSDNIEWLAEQLNSPLRRPFRGLRPTWR